MRPGGRWEECLGPWENRQDSATQLSSPSLPLGSCGSLKPHWVLVLMGPLLSPPKVTSLSPYLVPPHTMQLRLGAQPKLPPLIPIPAYTNNWFPWKCPWDRVEGGEGNSRGEAFLQR